MSDPTSLYELLSDLTSSPSAPQNWGSGGGSGMTPYMMPQEEMYSDGYGGGESGGGYPSDGYGGGFPSDGYGGD